MHAIRLIPIVLVLVLGWCALPARAADEKAEPVRFTRENVDKLVAGRVEMMWKSRNEHGFWYHSNDSKNNKPNPADVGTSCLVLLALKAAGADEQDPRFQQALGMIVEADVKGEHQETYVKGLRATLLGQLGSVDKAGVKKMLFSDARDLGNGIIPSKGMHTYAAFKGDYASYTTGDFSNTQYGVLGIWSASDQGMEVPIKYWQLVEQAYVKAQAKDGAWPYYWNQGKEAATGYASMTAGGLATLFVIWEKLYVARDAQCRNRVNPELVGAIEKGLIWMGRNFDPRGNFGRDDNNGMHWNDGYTYYGIERVGVASGMKYFGNHNWYREITEALLNGQAKPYGLLQNAWTLLFLTYGRAPVAFNKLRYEGAWNEHPREYAMLCKYLSRTYEKHHNWQIMPIGVKAEEFHDAPILAISGNKAAKFSRDEIDKLRAFLDRGGLIFAEAIDNSAAFRTSFETLCRQLYPHAELTPLDKEHPIYSAHFHLAGTPALMGVSDGVRTPIIFSPREISCDWQRLRLAAKENFQFGANLVQYASDGGQLWTKEESYWPTDYGKKSAVTITVGRLIHGAKDARHVWDPSGGQGWVRLDILSRNDGGPAIKTLETDLSEPLDPKAVPVLHLTGIGELKLEETARDNLKKYVQGGGLLLADPAGGNAAFDGSFRKLADALFGDHSLKPVPQLPWTAQATTEGKAWYRHIDKLPRAMRPLTLLGVNTAEGAADGWNVLFVPGDLTYALNGAPASDPVGLSPDSADKLVLALLTARAAKK